MNIQITEVRSATNNEWDTIWQKCDYATYFHSREWANIWHQYTKGKLKAEPKIIGFSDGKFALLPISFQKIYRGLTKMYISSPAGTFGGWISQNNLNKTHTNLLVNFCNTKLGNLLWRINPYDPILSKMDLPNSQYDETHAIKLNNDFNSLYKQWTKGHRSAVKKAIREGICIRVASTIDDWKDYYEVYQDSLRRWGEKTSSQYDWSFFYLIGKLNSPNIKLWLALKEDKIIAGAVCLSAKNHIVYWHGAALSDYFKLRPVNLLIYEIVKKSCQEGYLWFDFNPSSDHEGVKSFKKSFASKELLCPIINIERQYITNISKIKKILEQKLKYST